jgi:predicted metal-binding membrane protein
VEASRSSVDAASKRERWLVLGALLVPAALCWAWIVPMCLDMYGRMTGPSAWMMTHDWDFTHLVLLFAMWVVMMAGMMLPTAAPAILRYARALAPGDAGKLELAARVGAFAGGYLLVWAAFSLVATLLQRVFAELLWLTPMMEPGSRAFAAALLVIAGVFQLTQWKRACLESCRSSARCVSEALARGSAGGLRLGLAYGGRCLACCWALMLLLFVGGVMNLQCIAALTLFVLLEKFGVLGPRSVQFSGASLIAAGGWYWFAS